MRFAKTIFWAIYSLSLATAIVFIFSPLHLLLFNLIHPADFLATAKIIDTEVVRGLLLGLPTTSNLLLSDELAHLKDVRIVFLSLSLFSFLGSFYIAKTDLKKTTLYAIGLIVALGTITGLAFTQSFTLAHKLVFTNDLWLLNPQKHILIQVYPEKFFALSWLTILLLAIAFLYFVRKLKSK